MLKFLIVQVLKIFFMQIPKSPLYISYKYFMVKSKLSILEQNIDWHFVNKPSWCREQQGKCPLN